MLVETDEEYFVRNPMPLSAAAKEANRLMEPFSTLKEYELFRFSVGLGKHRELDRIIEE